MYMDRFTAFALNLANIERSLHKMKSKKMAEYGLRATHLMCMVQIFCHEDGLTSTEIARTCAIDKAFVSRITADLVDRKFVMFNEKYNDGRKYKQKFVLTEEGMKVMYEINDAVDRIIAKIYNQVSEDELKNFYKILEVLDNNINLATDEI